MKMKKTIAIILALVTLCLCVGLTACNNTDKKITGVTLKSQTVNYDGEKHSLKVQGKLPDGAKVEYSYTLLNTETVTTDGATDVGTYIVAATVTCKGYKPLELSATLTIKGERFADNLYLTTNTKNYTGNTFSLTVGGTLPEGTHVTYYYNDVQTDGVSAVGEYTVKAVLTNVGYETKTLINKLYILPLHFPNNMELVDKDVVYDGNAYRLELNIDQNTLPGNVGITVTYNDEQMYEATEVGVYEVKWVISCVGYETVTLTGMLIIRDAAQGE